MGSLGGPGVPRAVIRSHQKTLGITDRINVFLRHVLAQVLIWQLPEHNMMTSGVYGYGFLQNGLSQVMIWHLPEHELNPSGGLWAGGRRGLGWGSLRGLCRGLVDPWGYLGGYLGVPARLLGRF